MAPNEVSTITIDLRHMKRIVEKYIKCFQICVAT